VVAVLATAPARPLAAQWSVGAEIGLLACAGGATDTSASGNGNTLRPSTGTTYALRIARRFGRFGAGVSVLSMHAGAVAENDETLVELKGSIELLQVAPEMFVVLARPGTGGALLLHAGVQLDHWSVDSDGRDRVAGLAALSLDWPMTGRIVGTFRGGLAVGPSVFKEEELPDGFQSRLSWRGTIAAGVLLRL
jgi:hypothetical protein